MAKTYNIKNFNNNLIQKALHAIFTKWMLFSTDCFVIQSAFVYPATLQRFYSLGASIDIQIPTVRIQIIVYIKIKRVSLQPFDCAIYAKLL